jgi:hypothetical protein
VHHLAWVEAWWFQDAFGGITVDYPFDWKVDADAEFRMTQQRSVQSVLALSEANVKRSNEIVAAAPDLETTVHGRGQDHSLRWILVHMIDETARHAGHMDIIREQLDGTTGYQPPID